MFNRNSCASISGSGSSRRKPRRRFSASKISKAILGLEITKLLEDGATVEDGDRKALLNTETGARRPPWKDVYLDHMFVEHERPVADEERRVIGNCEPKTKQVLIVT